MTQSARHALPVKSARQHISGMVGCAAGSRPVRMTVRREEHQIVEALLLAAPTGEMDGDVGGNLDCLRQDLHDPAIYLLLRRGRQFEIGRDGREMAYVVASNHRQ